jgi:hypothetical protein
MLIKAVAIASPCMKWRIRDHISLSSMMRNGKHASSDSFATAHRASQ